MLHHVKEQHQSKLNRPGPWNTPHSLISKFWTENALDGDYGHMALDRDAWKSLTQCFLTWNAIPLDRTNVEFLDAQPWEHPKYLLRFHLAWLQVIFIHIHANKLEATWLDRSEGFCQWKSECEPHDDASLLIGGLTNLYCHLCMLSRPFVLQIVLPYHNTWRIVTSNMDKLRHMLLKSDYASWYQLFPLSETDCWHRSMRQCLTNFSSSPF